MNQKKPIIVGNTTMFAVTVPVNVVFDTFEENHPLDGWACEQFRLVETDGYYIVLREKFFEERKRDSEYRCFITEEDAWSYLEMHGIDKKDYVDDPEEKEETDFGREYD